MLIPSTRDGQMIEVNFIDANLKMAVAAEAKGDKAKTEFHFNRARAAEAVIICDRHAAKNN